MSKRVLVVVSRGVTDATPVRVWEHEVPILDAVHGEGAVRRLQVKDLVEKKNQKTTVLPGTTQTVIQRDLAADHPLKKVELESIATHELLARHLKLGEEFDGDPRQEYQRLVDVYGMHKEYKMPNVEYVYGRESEGRFLKSLGVKPPEEMNIAELRAALEKNGIEYEQKNTKNELVDLLKGIAPEEELEGEQA
jgi:hypothetical protein